MKVIDVSHVKKVYALYDNKKDKLKEALSLSGKKRHTDFYALNDVGFQVEKGECIGIIGLNGSGKSTLLKILAGVITQSEGNVNIQGKISALLELGAGFNPEYTGMENIYLNAMIMGYTEQETKTRIQGILDFADIGSFIDQPVKVYSSGMFVRLAFAIAINVEPDILIVDEALSVGDVFFQQKCYKKMKELSGKSTVIIVSHDLNAITKFCNRIIVMNKGALEFDGEPNKGITHYYKIKQGQARQMSLQLLADSGSQDGLDARQYRKPDKNNYSGKLDVVIEKYFYSIADIPFMESCTKGDEICVSMLVSSKRIINNLIIGYQVRDKYSNEVFGETSLTSEVEQYPLCAGMNLISFQIAWPEIREGDYFITLGVGEGQEILNQVEQCWINNAIHVTATTHGKTIFGVFNHPMENYMIAKI